MDGILQIELSVERREIVGVGVHVIAVPGLAGMAMPTAVMRDHPKALLAEEQHLPSQSSAVSGQPWLNTMGCPLPQSL